MVNKKPVDLKVVLNTYDPLDFSSISILHIKRSNLLEALKVLVDTAGVYLSSEDVEDDHMTAEDVINHLKENNGDGCDMIWYMSDINSNKVYIDECNFTERSI